MPYPANLKEHINNMRALIQDLQEAVSLEKHMQVFLEIKNADDINMLSDTIITMYSIMETEQKKTKRSVTKVLDILINIQHEYIIYLTDKKMELDALKKELEQTKTKKTDTTTSPSKTPKNIYDLIVRNPIKVGVSITLSILLFIGGLMLFNLIDADLFKSTAETLTQLNNKK